MSKELIDFREWVLNGGYDSITTISMLGIIDDYMSINSAQVESPSVSENEHQEKDCDNCRYGHIKSYEYPCKYCDRYSRWEQSD
jgi:hypothetical protein